VLKRARPILYLVSLAAGLKSLQVDEAELLYWLYDYKVPYVKTFEDYELIETTREIPGRNLKLTVSGGIELTPIVVRLQAGDVTALRDVVLKSRPSESALIWHPPLDGWHIPGTENLQTRRSPGASSRRARGIPINRVLMRVDYPPVDPTLVQPLDPKVFNPKLAQPKSPKLAPSAPARNCGAGVTYCQR
jgi:hypothetical protein